MARKATRKLIFTLLFQAVLRPTHRLCPGPGGISPSRGSTQFSAGDGGERTCWLTKDHPGPNHPPGVCPGVDEKDPWPGSTGPYCVWAHLGAIGDGHTPGGGHQ